ncbi:hypothetical protein NST54_13710 [Caldifermentibacillus hisashii]|uniref:hypothetical protein n=1 Tax=Caldifermentibacillus hisashii TaxID=996558 RepID=UPI0034D4B36A
MIKDRNAYHYEADGSNLLLALFVGIVGFDKLTMYTKKIDGGRNFAREFRVFFQ